MKKIILPGSKSITNRDLILGALTSGTCQLKGYLDSVDTIRMIESLRTLGIDISKNTDSLIVNGGVEKIIGNDSQLYVHQSGTSMRFLTGLAILNKNKTINISGDERLSQRPMGDLIQGISELGVKIISDNGYPPVAISASEITNNVIKMNGTSSSQFFTALLQVGAFIKGGLEIEVSGELVSKPYIDITIHELSKFGINVVNDDYKKFIISEQNIINPGIIQVEGDASALSYIANISVLFNKQIEILNLGSDTKQGDYKYIDILTKAFGFSYTANSKSTKLLCNRVNKQENKLLEIDFESMPDVSMSFMSLAPLLPGNTKITGLQTLNLKECKRIDVMGEGLKQLGVDISYDENSITIGEGFSPSGNIDIQTHDDHRIAMSFAVLGKYLENKYDTKINILQPECVTKTYPNFWIDLDILLK